MEGLYIDPYRVLIDLFFELLSFSLDTVSTISYVRNSYLCQGTGSRELSPKLTPSVSINIEVLGNSPSLAISPFISDFSFVFKVLALKLPTFDSDLDRELFLVPQPDFPSLTPRLVSKSKLFTSETKPDFAFSFKQALFGVSSSRSEKEGTCNEFLSGLLISKL